MSRFGRLNILLCLLCLLCSIVHFPHTLSFASKKLYFKFASFNSSSTFLVQQIVVINTSWVMREAPEGSSMEKLAKGSVPIH